MIKDNIRIGIFSAAELEVIQEPLDMAKILAEEGYQVKLIAPIRKEVIKHYTNFGFYIKRVPLIRKNTTRLRSLEFLLKALFYNWRKYDIVIGVDSVGLIVAYLLYKLGKGRVLVYYALELSLAEEGAGYISVFLQNYLAKYADIVVVTGKGRAIAMKERLSLSTHPLVIENCPLHPAPQRDNFLKKVLEDKGYKSDFIVIYQGGLNPDRCIMETIYSVKAWKVNAVLVILGYGDEKYIKELKCELEKENFRSKVFYLGWLPGTRDDFLKFISGADIGLGFLRWRNLNNSNATFWTPNKLYDYMACAMPVIFSDNPSLKFIQDEGLGLCVNPEHPEEIAKAINEILSDRAHHRKMSETARTLFNEKYNYQNQIKSFLEELRKLNKCHLAP